MVALTSNPEAYNETNDALMDPSTQAGAIGGADIYKRLQQRQRRPNWLPALAVLVIAAGGGALAVTLINHHMSPKPISTAANTTPAPLAAQGPVNPAPANAAPAAEPTVTAAAPTEVVPPAESPPAKVETSASKSTPAIHHAVMRTAAVHSGSPDATPSTDNPPAAPIPYTATANGAGADVNATQGTPNQPAPAQTATPMTNAAAPATPAPAATAPVTTSAAQAPAATTPAPVTGPVNP